MWDLGFGMRNVLNCYNVGCGMWDVGCGMWDVKCGMLDVGSVMCRVMCDA